MTSATENPVETLLKEAGFNLMPQGGGVMNYTKPCLDERDYVSIGYQGEHSNQIGDDPTEAAYIVGRYSHETDGYIQSGEAVDLKSALANCDILRIGGHVGDNQIECNTVTALVEVSSYAVKDNISLGTVSHPKGWFRNFAVFSSKIGGPNPLNGPLALNPDADLRQASEKDFDDFRVCSKGFFTDCTCY